jgi:hypothetical protein
MTEVKSYVRLRAGKSRDIWHVVKDYDYDTGLTRCGVVFSYLDIIEGRDIMPAEYVYNFKLRICEECEP